MDLKGISGKLSDIWENLIKKWEFRFVFEYLSYGLGINLIVQMVGIGISIPNILGCGFVWYLMNTEMLPRMDTYIRNIGYKL